MEITDLTFLEEFCLNAFDFLCFLAESHRIADDGVVRSKASIPFLDRHISHSSEEYSTSTTSPSQINNNGHEPQEFQPSAYSRSNSSFLIEDILFQRPKVSLK